MNCKKEALKPTSSQSQQETLELHSSRQFVKGFHRYWFDHGSPLDGVDYGCRDGAGNCLDDVVVKGKALGAINATLAVVNSGNEIAIKTVFANYRNILINQMREEDVDKVISGEFKAIVRGSNPSENRYMILKDASSTLEVAVYPFVK